MDFGLLLESYGAVWTSLQVILMTFLGACGGVLLGATAVIGGADGGVLRPAVAGGAVVAPPCAKGARVSGAVVLWR